MEFLTATTGGEQIVAEVVDDRSVVGHFFGMLVRPYGMKVLGSPMAGWTTGFMGFHLDEGIDRAALIDPLRRFAFGDVGAMYLELRDRHMGAGDAPAAACAGELTVMEVDLLRSEIEIFASLSSAARRCVRKAEKTGVTVEECSGEAFADDYFAQLVDVFAKQRLVPTYDVERVRSLIRALEPSGSLLLLRARSPEGRSIATGIFPGYGSTAYFWGGASWREHQGYRPNEAIMWHAFRHWKARGVERFDLGGGGNYKLKYGPHVGAVPTWAFGRVPGLLAARNAAASAVAIRQRLLGRLHRRRGG